MYSRHSRFDGSEPAPIAHMATTLLCAALGAACGAGDVSPGPDHTSATANSHSAGDGGRGSPPDGTSTDAASLQTGHDSGASSSLVDDAGASPKEDAAVVGDPFSTDRSRFLGASR